ncbi:MAG: NIPSNAP family protein [candidate division NC10 bacterium]
MIYELRPYTLHPGKAPEFIQHAGGIAMPIRGDRYGKLAGYWSTDVGTLNQVLHLWAYDDMAHRTRARAELSKNERWNAEYVPKIRPLLSKQENTILIPADFKQVEPSAQGHGVYEFRTYRLYPGRVADWLATFKSGLAAREKYSKLFGLWSSDVGELNRVAHLWGYTDLNHRAQVRKDSLADPVWKETVGKLAQFMQLMENKLLIPTEFSPLR